MALALSIAAGSPATPPPTLAAAGLDVQDPCVVRATALASVDDQPAWRPPHERAYYDAALAAAFDHPNPERGGQLAFEAREALEAWDRWDPIDRARAAYQAATAAMNAELSRARQDLERERARYNRRREELMRRASHATTRAAVESLRNETRAGLEDIRTRLLPYRCWLEAAEFVEKDLDSRIVRLGGAPSSPAPDAGARPVGPGGRESTPLTGGCAGTLEVNRLGGREGDELVFTIRILPPADDVIARVVMVSKEGCGDPGHADPAACDASRTGAGSYKGIFKRLSRFVGQGAFVAEFRAYDAAGVERCAGRTDELRSFPR
jgi:hypothetical protein